MLFVFDWDGTLVGKSGILNQDIILGIKKIHNLNHNLIIATGRHPSEVSNKIKSNKCLSNYVIGANGSIIIDRKLNTTIFSNLINKDLMKSVITEIKNNIDKIKYLKILHDNEIYRFRNVDDLFNNDIIIENQDILNDPAALIGVEFKDNVEFKKMISLWNKKYKGVLEISVSANNFLNFNNHNTSKWSAVKWILKNTNIENIHVVAFGDSLNDYHMLKNANTAVVVGKKHSELIEIAHFHIDHPDELGLLKFAEKLEVDTNLLTN